MLRWGARHHNALKWGENPCRLPSWDTHSEGSKMPAQTRLFLCLKDNFGVLVHDPASGATAAIDAPEADHDHGVLGAERDELVGQVANRLVQKAYVRQDQAEAEALAVVDSRSDRHVVGLLSESHALRRYSEELESRRRELFRGE